MSRYERFDRSRLKLKPLTDREHDLSLSCVLPLEYKKPRQELALIGEKILAARERSRAVVMMIGAHVLRSGVQRYIIDMMERGLISCLAVNGACAIHDFEFASIGQTTESVAKYIKEGQFGLWRETGRINDVAARAANENLGFGEALGEEILDGDYPYKDISVFAAGARFGVPVTVHVGVGYDIIHEHPNCDGAALGAASYTDFLIFARVLESLASGVVSVFGSAVMAPEVFLKALAMARNVAMQDGKTIDRFDTLVCDLRPLPGDYASEAPKSNPDYYFRPWKTLLVRTPGTSRYVCALHVGTVPELWSVFQGN